MEKTDFIVIGVCIVIILCLVASFIGITWAECEGATKDIGLPNRFLVIGGCQVQENGQWIPLNNWRYFGD